MSEKTIPGFAVLSLIVLKSELPYKFKVPSVEKIAIALLSKSSFLQTANWPLLRRPIHHGSPDWLALSLKFIDVCLDDPVVSIKIL